VTVLIAALAAGCGGGNEAEMIASARTSMSKQDYKTAIVQLKALLQKNANSGEARLLLGQSMLEEGDSASALVELTRARELKVDEALLAPKLARAMLALDKSKPLIEQFSKVTLSSPEPQAELHTAVALAYARLRNMPAAEAELDKALTAVPKFGPGLKARARIAASKGDIDRALALLDQSMSPQEANGEAWLLKGDLLFRGKRDGASALPAYQKALLDPKYNLAAHRALVELHVLQRQSKEAHAQFELMQKSYPNDVQTAFAAAQLAYLDKNNDKAKEILQNLLRLAPDNTVLLTFAGGVDVQRGAVLQAEAELGKAVQLAPEMNTARKLLAETYLRLGQPAKAHAVLRPMIEGDRADGDALSLMANAYLHEGDIAKAEALFNQAAKLKPQDPNIRTALALTDLARGRAESAFGTLRSISASDGASTTADMALISALLRRQDVDGALKAIEVLRKKEPNKPTASYLQGVALLKRRDFAGARAAFEAALKIEPAHFLSTANLASLDLAEQKVGAARERLEAAVKLNPGNAAASVALVEVMERQQAKPEDVLKVLNDAIAASPTEAAPRLGLVARLIRAKDKKGALVAAQAALTVLPDNVDVLDALGLAQALAGDEQQAISTFNKVASLDPQSPQPYLRLAELYGRRNDAAATALSIKRALDVAPQSSEVQQRVLAWTAKTKDPKLALDGARALQKSQPGNAAGYLFEGDAHATLKNWAAAQAAYRQGLDKVDPSSRAPTSVFTAITASGQPAEAEKFAADWLKRHPKDAAFMVHLGGLAMLRRDNAAAERQFSNVLAIEPDNVMALNNVAWLIAERQGKGALAYAEKAASLAPGQAPVLDTLARILAYEGKTERAIEVERQAMSLLPDRHSYRLHLAKYLLKAGDTAKAKVELDTLAALGAKFDAQSEVAELRKSLPQ
jgi:putative PEP-CTERM system TPR-repeat lipoprotein